MGAVVVLFLTLVLLFLVLGDFGLASPKQKLVAFLIVGIIGASISVYTYQQNQQNQREIALQRAFLRGDTLLCKGIKVNNQTFKFSERDFELFRQKTNPYERCSCGFGFLSDASKRSLNPTPMNPPINPNE